MKYIVLLFLLIAGNVQAMCGDCNKDHQVTVDELMTVLDDGLDATDDPLCGDCDQSGRITVNDMVVAVENALVPDPFEACGVGCSSSSQDSPCAVSCEEATGTINGAPVVCPVTVCRDTEDQFNDCLNILLTNDWCEEN